MTDDEIKVFKRVMYVQLARVYQIHAHLCTVCALNPTPDNLDRLRESGNMIRLREEKWSEIFKR